MTETNSLNEFAAQFRQRVETRCESDSDDEEKFQENMFTDEFLSCLEQGDEIEDWHLCRFENEKARIKVNAVDLPENDDLLTLVITHFTNSIPPQTLTKDQVDSIFNSVKRFFHECKKGFYKNIEESHPVYEFARRIYEAKMSIRRVRLFLLTDARVTRTAKDPESIGDSKITYEIWDIARLQRMEGEKGGREIITINFLNEYKLRIPCLLSPNSENLEHETCVAIFPGEVLAGMYEKYGSKLLQRNVRAFLQARGAVNSSIRNTILKEPERFLAYNNGITATAADVKFTQNSAGWAIESVTDFQIVNGGQTTAGIYYARARKNADLSKVSVQAKVSRITDPSLTSEIVPLISKYANSQNKISESDFSSNDPVHARLHELSQIVWTQPLNAQEIPTHWYYERARGQYAEEKARKGAKFSKQNPVSQLFDKTEMAKVSTCWIPAPHLASLGPQKNFLIFTRMLASENKDLSQVHSFYSQDFFKKLIAKIIIYRYCKHSIEEQKKLYSANRNNIVVYSLAYLVERNLFGDSDLLEVWRTQKPPANLPKILSKIFAAVHERIQDLNGDKIYTETCKKSTTWDTIKSLQIELP